jgi:hypothetical protein
MEIQNDRNIGKHCQNSGMVQTQRRNYDMAIVCIRINRTPDLLCQQDGRLEHLVWKNTPSQKRITAAKLSCSGKTILNSQKHRAQFSASH